jgi:hypothetical protein
VVCKKYFIFIERISLSRNWILVHLQNHLSSIYMRFYPLKRHESVLLDKIFALISDQHLFLLVINQEYSCDL